MQRAASTPLPPVDNVPSFETILLVVDTSCYILVPYYYIETQEKDDKDEGEWSNDYWNLEVERLHLLPL